MAVSRKRMEFATVNFVSRLRREWARLNPGKTIEECPVRPLDAYSPEHRGAMIDAIAVAITSAGPDSEGFYQDWLVKQGAQT